jgi:Flp pilus assembly protein CpaB
MSVLAALLAGILIVVYVARYRSSINAEGAPVTVLIAKQAIPKGTAGAVIATSGLYSATTVRQSQLLNGAYSDASSLRDRVAARDIYPGSQLTTADFAPAVSNIAATLTKHDRIVTIPFDVTHGLTRDLQPGSRVDVYAGFNLAPVTQTGAASGAGQARPVVRMIMSNIYVASIVAGNIDFKVSDKQATQLAFASDNGKLWLALRPSANAETDPPSLVTVETLMLGVPPIAVYKSLGGRG